MGKNKNAIDWDEEFIRSNYNNMTLVEMANVLSKKEPRIDAKNLSRYCKKIGLSKLTMKSDIELEDDEEFRDIPGFANYKVSQYGKVWCTKTNSIITIGDDRRGYKIAKITDSNNNKRTMPLHRLIAFAWIENDDPDNKIEVDHIDGDKMNNSISNLEWVTPQENLKRARENELNKSKPSDHKRMSEDDVIKLYTYCINNPNYTTKEVADMFGVSQATVRNIMNGKRHSNITKNL